MTEIQFIKTFYTIRLKAGAGGKRKPSIFCGEQGGCSSACSLTILEVKRLIMIKESTHHTSLIFIIIYAQLTSPSNIVIQKGPGLQEIYSYAVI